MVFCNISALHDGNSPPAGVVRVQVSGDPGTYNCRAIKNYDNSLFAGPSQFKLPEDDHVDLPIADCNGNNSNTLKTASICVQAAEEESEYIDKETRIINYKCA